MEPVYIHELPQWPHFQWDTAAIAGRLGELRHRQGRLLGRMESLGFPLRQEAQLETLTLDVLKSSEIEGEALDASAVRSSVARRLGLDTAGAPPSRDVDGVVEMMLDATRRFEAPLEAERLWGWQASLFPAGRSAQRRIIVGAWRNDATGPMQVVSGAAGRERVHFEAPAAARVPGEMAAFLAWANDPQVAIDPVLRAALAHLWFVTIHPFDDGNGRIARAIADWQLARSERTAQRFYSMSAEIRRDRDAYYAMLERTQRGTLDVTPWLHWFLTCLDGAFAASERTLAAVLRKARFWEAHAHTLLNDRQRQMLNRLLDGFDGKLTSAKWAALTKCSHDTALRDINALIAAGVLARDDAGGRSTGYVLAE